MFRCFCVQYIVFDTPRAAQWMVKSAGDDKYRIVNTFANDAVTFNSSNYKIPLFISVGEEESATEFTFDSMGDGEFILCTFSLIRRSESPRKEQSLNRRPDPVTKIGWENGNEGQSWILSARITVESVSPRSHAYVLASGADLLIFLRSNQSRNENELDGLSPACKINLMLRTEPHDINISNVLLLITPLLSTKTLASSKLVHERCLRGRRLKLVSREGEVL
ncbi:hypothetical protein B0H17DRAFT_1128377 [Mycena rosella]|uniref:Uncharacterized protein n=1 Tax=Mycena rosella TaxID=1033263 RepID=A0AAD7GQV8_MYCRO|nr:hypothetical protein B0H17DRAFT_1128377 [Mycena rosella]